MIQNLDITLSSKAVQVEPGESFTLSITLTNYGGQVDRFELSLPNLDASWYQFDYTEMQLYPDPPGNEGIVLLHLKIPATAVIGEMFPVIEVRSDLGGLAIQPFQLIVAPPKGLKAEFTLIPPQTTTNLRQARYRLDIVNPFNWPLTYKLEGRSDRSDIRLSFIPETVEIPPQGQAVSLLQTNLPYRNYYKSDQYYNIDILANTEKQLDTTLIQTPLFPWLRKLLLTPALLGLLFLLPLLLVGGLILFTVLAALPKEEAAPPPGVCSITDSGTTARLYARPDGLTEILVTTPGSSKAQSILTPLAPSDKLPGLFSNLLSVSPDGKKLAYVTAANEAMDEALIYTIGTNGGRPQAVANIKSGLWPTRPVWSEDSSQLAYTVLPPNNTSLELRVVDANGGNGATLKTPPQLTPQQFYGSPNRDIICWTKDNYKKRILVRPPASNKQYEVSLTDKNRVIPEYEATPFQLKPPAVAAPVAFKEPPLADLPPGECFVPTFSQLDPEWRNAAMKGKNNLNDKIGEAGCALTASAIVLNYLDNAKQFNSTPGAVNSICLTAEANPFSFERAASQCSKNAVQGQKQDFSWDKLNEILRQGRPAIVGLLGGQTGTHYVVVLAGGNGIASTYRVNDPWDGTNSKSLGSFVDSGYQLRWLVDYNLAGAKVCTRTDPNKFSGPFTISQPTDGAIYTRPINFNYDPASKVISSTLYGFVAVKPLATRELQSNLLGFQAQPNTTPTVPGTTPAPIVPTLERGLNLNNGDAVSLEAAYQLTMEDNNPGSEAFRRSVRFIIDYTPPKVDLTLAPNFFSNENGLKVARTPVTIEFKASDNLSGIASIEYSLSLAPNTDTNWQTYTNDTRAKSFPVEAPGRYTLKYRATDGAGLVSEENSLEFVYTKDIAIPTIAPTTTAGTAVSVVLTPTATPTPTPPPGMLTAAPNVLLFDASQTPLTISLSNIGQSPLDWALQPPTDAGVGFLDFDSFGGTLGPGQNQVITVQLRNLNFSSKAIRTTFPILYNNGSKVNITATINPPPPPTVVFAAPVPGTVLSKFVPIKLLVSSSVNVLPDHADIFATYVEQPGSDPVTKKIATLRAGDNWLGSWDVSNLPPQAGIILNADVCWSGDANSCLKNVSNVAGLIVGKPGAVVTLNPNSDKLFGKVKITAVPNGVVDHVTYTYTSNGSSFALPKATKDNNFTIDWDTSLIPPQTGIGFNALVCWGATDDPNTCGAPSNLLPTSFTVEPPTMTLNPLSPNDAKELPIKVRLSGTANKINNPATAIFVIVKAPGTVQDNLSVKIDGLTPTASSTGWSTEPVTGSGRSDFDTTGWNFSPSIAFTTKICWDGTLTGGLCSEGPAIFGSISAPTATFSNFPAAPLNVNSVNLTVLPVPANRVTSVNFTVTYTPDPKLTGVVGFQRVLVSQQATISNNFTLAFDVIKLGLKPGQVTFKLTACFSPGICGLPSSDSPPLIIPLPTLSDLQPAPGTIPVPLNSSTTLPIVATLNGPGAYEVRLVKTYKTQPQDTKSVATTDDADTTVAYPRDATKPGWNKLSFKWDLTLLPPQDDVQLSFRVCWGSDLTGDELEQSRKCYDIPAYSGLNIAIPKVSNIYFNGGRILAQNPQPYSTSLTLPIPITQTTTPKISLPVESDLVNSNFNVTAVNWVLEIQNPPKIIPLATTSVISDSAGNGFTSPITLVIDTAALGGVNPFSTVMTLTGSPVWKSASAAVGVDYYFNPTSRISVPIKFVNFSVSLTDSTLFSGPKVVAGTTAPIDSRALLMFKSSTTISGTINYSGADNPIKRIVLRANYEGSDSFVLEQVLTFPNTAPNSNVWSSIWNHLNGELKRPILSDPDKNITLSWQVCSDATIDDFRNCLPLNVGGAVTQVSGLKVVGLRYNSTTLDPTNFASVFNNTIELKNADFNANPTQNGLIPQLMLRYFAYPSSATPDTSKRVPLASRLLGSTKSGTTTLVTQQVYWPSNKLTEIDNLANAATDQKLSIGVQYCSKNPVNDAEEGQYCSNWAGTDTEQIFAAGRDKNGAIVSNYGSAIVKGFQLAVISWKLYRNDPSDANVPSGQPAATTIFDEYLQPQNLGAAGDATLKVLVRPLKPVVTPLGLSFSYSAPGSASPISKNNPGSVSVSGPDAQKFYTFSAIWNFQNIAAIGLPLDPPASPNRSVRLTATLDYGNNLTTEATVNTHGAVNRPEILVNTGGASDPHFVPLTTLLTVDNTGPSAVLVGTVTINAWKIKNADNSVNSTFSTDFETHFGFNLNTSFDTTSTGCTVTSDASTPVPGCPNTVLVSTTSPGGNKWQPTLNGDNTLTYRLKTTDTTTNNIGYSSEGTFSFLPIQLNSKVITSNGTSKTLTLTWKNPFSANNRVDISSAPIALGFAPTQAATCDINGCSWTTSSSVLNSSPVYIIISSDDGNGNKSIYLDKVTTNVATLTSKKVTIDDTAVQEDISWTTGSGTTSKVEYKLSTGGGWTTAAGCGSSPCTITGLVVDSSYDLRITDSNSVITTLANAFDTNRFTITVTGKNLTLDGAAVQEDISWTVAGGVGLTSKLEYKSGGSYVDPPTACPASPCAITGLTKNKTYNFRLIATDPTGNTTIVYDTFDTNDGYSSTVKERYFSTAGATTEVTIAWDVNAAGSTNWSAAANLKPGGLALPGTAVGGCGTSGGNTCTVKFTGSFTAGTSYGYRLVIVDAARNKTKAVYYTFTFGSFAVASPPTVATNTVTISWTDNVHTATPDNTNSFVQFKKTTDTVWTKAVVSAAADYSCTGSSKNYSCTEIVRGLASATYSYQIVIIDASGSPTDYYIVTPSTTFIIP